MDRIILEGMQFYTYHGVDEAEQALGQPLTVDVEMALDLGPAGREDDLSRTVDYAAVYTLVREAATGRRRRLLEAVAEDVARLVLDGFAPVQRVRVRVTKPRPPIPGPLAAASVEIVRERRGGEGE
ncbi:MAG: dihydroneopterin aldolase [Bacillota bacterium]|nr:dihydroneopterin aldolase [Bacillota bacterium]